MSSSVNVHVCFVKTPNLDSQFETKRIIKNGKATNIKYQLEFSGEVTILELCI